MVLGLGPKASVVFMDMGVLAMLLGLEKAGTFLDALVLFLVFRH